MEDNKQKVEKKAWWQPALEFFAQIAGWIVFPILAAIALGTWLDTLFGTGQKLYFSCVAIAFIITFVGLIVNTKSAMKKMEALEKAKPETKS
jgi:hypothetical protein